MFLGSRRHLIAPAVCLSLVIAIVTVIGCATTSGKGKSTTRPTTTKKTKPATKPQQLCLRETDPTSPRRTRLKSATTNPSEIVRIDLDGDGDPDMLETWL
jgi:hypothetical protein